MFWNTKPKLPITIEDKKWIELSIKFLRLSFGEKQFKNIKTVTPTEKFFDRKFEGNEEDAKFILKRTIKLMNVQKKRIQLNFFSDQPIEMDDGTILTTPADADGKWKSAAGTYQKSNSITTISIETSQLKDTTSLISTISHELSHQLLLGEKRIIENDEYLTDLTAIFFGFGIFLGNSRFKFSTNTNGTGFGWEMSRQGYLPEQIIAYTMAFLSIERRENIDYIEYLNKSMKKYFKQSIKYLENNK